LTLVRAGTTGDVGVLQNEDVISTSCKLNIRANVECASNVRSVVFRLNGTTYRIENTVPYALAGDVAGNYNQMNLAPGSYTLRAIPYSGLNGTGTQGISYEIWFTVTSNTSRSCLSNNNNNNNWNNNNNNSSSKMTVNEDVADYEIRVYPNPNRGEFEVSLRVDEPGDLHVRLYDVSGKAIYEDIKQRYSGAYSQKIYLHAHPAGVYFLAVSVNDDVHTKKVLFLAR